MAWGEADSTNLKFPSLPANVEGELLPHPNIMTLRIVTFNDYLGSTAEVSPLQNLIIVYPLTQRHRGHLTLTLLLPENV